ncbi:hypothetical protein [Hasllibacter sp. MH4015]|uniref:hypothetical protein n=1 Tax=Hasllibacter sp. MH4015 TaxID=2854029 RepID=UPI001CD2D19B|nr:hypothetical protein [Hasllibacter sp. MH4015]
MVEPRLTTAAACKVAQLNRDRFNEHVASGAFTCAPATVPGRSRYFKPKDMIALRLFRDLLEDGLNARAAGHIACEVSKAARQNPSVKQISYVFDWFASPSGYACPFSEVPEDWEIPSMHDTDVRQVWTFNVSKLRKLIAHYTEIERSIIGPED